MPRVWRYGLVYFCVLVGLYGFSFWLPQIIASLGKLTNVQVGAVTTIPYALACIALVLWGRHSDATGERSWHVALPPLLAALALAAGGWLTEPVAAFGGALSRSDRNLCRIAGVLGAREPRVCKVRPRRAPSR